MLIIPSVILAINSDEDREYMANLYYTYYKDMLKTAKEFCYDLNEIDDIISDGCVKLINNIDRVRSMDDGALRRYIYAVIRSAAFDYYRKRRRLNSRFFHISEQIMEQLPDENDVEERIVLKDQVEYVLRLIETLSPKERMVLLLKYTMGLSDTEIAESIGLAANSVRKYAERGRARIKDRLYK